MRTALRVLLAATVLGLPATTAPPPLLSRRAHALAGGGWTLNVTDLGSATVTVSTAVGGTTFEIVSAFSEPGPRWNALGDITDMPVLGSDSMMADHPGAAVGRSLSGCTCCPDVLVAGEIDHRQ